MIFLSINDRSVLTTLTDVVVSIEEKLVSISQIMRHIMSFICSMHMLSWLSQSILLFIIHFAT